jgi:predicted Rossmann fold flavoprotein
MTAQRRILVIGGGASGMMAAIAAARRGARVTVLERMQRVGKKLLATGNGRCNLTNLNPQLEHYHGGSPRLALEIIAQFDVEKTMRFFEELGVALRAEEDGKVYPATNQAAAVLELLRDEMDRLGVETICEAAAVRIEKANGALKVVTGEERSFTTDRVIIAAGGKSSPNLGSNGAGCKLAEALGHRITATAPALVQLRIDAPFLKHTQGVRVEAAAEVWVGGEKKRREAGEILFTDYGLSGICIMDLSRDVALAGKDARVQVVLDLLPDLSPDVLLGHLHQRLRQHPERTVEFAFVGLLHKRVIPVLLRAAGVEELNAPASSLTKPQIQKIAETLKAWLLPCLGTQSWMFSQVTAGGVDLKQLDRHTLESKLVPGVFFCGEVLDVDGDCGGYNLQWAWSSGWVAGSRAAA